MHERDHATPPLAECLAGESSTEALPFFVVALGRNIRSRPTGGTRGGVDDGNSMLRTGMRRSHPGQSRAKVPARGGLRPYLGRIMLKVSRVKL
ncbi:hypothetical protein PCLA_05f0629 [Pseudomonas citronellolis]|nr:hypothetical protein PCLA_05f0629 [Pseudomonas citronellolis]